MDFASTILLSILVMMPFCSLVHGDPLVSAIVVFGDSIVDVGNNNKLHTVIKANFLPYGRDFVTHKPTGRFSDGKLVVDFIAEALGFSSFPPAYLSLESDEESNEHNLLIGSNFASAGSGYSEIIAKIYGTIPLLEQLQNYKEYQTRVVNLVGEAKANDILLDTLFLLNTGSTDFITYFIMPFLWKAIPFDKFTDLLVASYYNFIENLHALGARKIGVTTLATLGCVPAVMTLYGSNQCITSVNEAVISFNRKFNITSESLKSRFPDLILKVLDIYGPFSDIIKRPSFYGFTEVRRGCCGLGLLDFSALVCNSKSLGTCSNSTTFVFWDGIHQTEAFSKIMAEKLLAQGAGTLIP